MDKKVTERLLTEKYRPKTIEEIVLPNNIRTQLEGYIKEKDIPNLMLYGNAGLGKTTLSRILIDALGYDFIEINGSLDTSIEEVRTKITRFISSVSLTSDNPVKCVYVDEADGFSQQAMNALKNLIESSSKYARFIFATNHIDQMTDPLRSRCVEINFDVDKKHYPQMMKEFMKRCSGILDTENVIYENKVVASVIRDSFPDMRKIVNNLAKYSSTGELIVNSVNEDTLFEEIVSAMKEKDFNKIRSKISEVTNHDGFILKMYSRLSDIFEDKSTVSIILHLAEAGYQSTRCVSKEINLLSMIIKIMKDGVSYK